MNVSGLILTISGKVLNGSNSNAIILTLVLIAGFGWVGGDGTEIVAVFASVFSCELD